MERTEPVDSGEAKSVEEELEELLLLVCTRDLSAVEYPIIHLSGLYSKQRDGAGAGAVYRTLVMATGVARTGEIEPLGVAVGDSEDPRFWGRFLLSLRVRGLKGVNYVASADHGGLQDALAAVFPKARWHLADSLHELAVDAPALLGLTIEADDAAGEAERGVVSGGAAAEADRADLPGG